MKKTLLLLLCPLIGYAQTTDSANSTPRFRAAHTVFAGVQAPLNYVAGYRLQFNRRVSVQVQGGLIAAPFDRFTLKTLETFGLDPTLSRAIDRSFRRGSSLGVGVNLHANSPWYAGAFGQYIRLAAGPITPADGLGIYFKRDFSGFGLLNSPTFVFNLQSNLWVGGIRVGRSIRFGDSPFGLNAEASLGKIVATRNTFSSNRALVDGLGVTRRLYNDLDNEIDAKLRRNGFLPTLNVLLTYRLGGGAYPDQSNP